MFIARQPIFDKNLSVFGYELLFRMNEKSRGFDGINAQSATAAVIIGLYELGLENIVEDKMAFINFDEVFIHSDALELIKPNRMIVEMLENIAIDSQLLQRLDHIKEKGYQIALDDFNEKFDDYPLMPYANIIKYDLMLTPLESIAEEIPKVVKQGKILLAEKVETQEVYQQASAMGFQLFQGCFFSKPSIAGRSCNKSPTKIQYFQLISELKKEDPSFVRLAEMIELDAVLSYRILRMASVRSHKKTVKSIQSVLAFMGLNQIERWLSTLMLQDLSQDKPLELMKLSMIRSYFAELIAKELEMNESDCQNASLMGLFSALDGILDQPIEEALADIIIPTAISDALVFHKGPLALIYELILAYEKGDWDFTNKIITEMGVECEKIAKDYQKSILWMHEMMKAMV